jgi:hypothetical protein
VLQRYQAAPLTAEQKAKLKAAVDGINPDAKLTEADAEKVEGQITAALSPEQQQLMDDLRPFRGGGGGGRGGPGAGGGFGGGGFGGGGGNMPAGMGNGPGGNAPGARALGGNGPGGMSRPPNGPAGGFGGGGFGGGGGGGGGAQDEPFKEGANRDRLTELKKSLGG